MSRYYSSSLVPRDWHAPELVELMQSPLSIDMVSFVAAKTMDSIKCRPPPEAPPSPPTTPGTEMKDEYSPDCLPPLDYFIQSILTKSRCHVPTLLCTLVYLERLKKRLPTHARGCHTTRHRVFLAVLIVAAKYLNDSSPQNKHWQRYAAFFQLSEITLMERQLLTILNFDLNFTEDELMACLRPLLHPEETLAVEEPVAVPSTAPIEEHRSLAAEISASAIDADLVERGASAKRKRLDRRAGMSPVQRRPSLPEEATTTVQPLSVKRLTPEYVVKPEATAQEYPSSASSSRRSSASVDEVQQPGLPSAPAPALRRPQLRSFLLRGSTSSVSQAPRPARVESWASSDASNSPSTFRSSIMSCSSTSTVSSASTGPRTPPTPMEDHAVKKLPFSMANLALASSSCAPDAQAREVLVVEEDDVSIAPTPSLIQALAHQPDLWPLMYSSGVSSRQARSMSSTAQKQRARLIESGDAPRRGSSLISV